MSQPQEEKDLHRDVKSLRCTADSKKLDHGHRMNYAPVTVSFGCGLQDVCLPRLRVSYAGPGSKVCPQPRSSYHRAVFDIMDVI